MKRRGKNLVGRTLAAAALLIPLLVCEDAGAQSIDAAFEFEGFGVTPGDASVDIGQLTLSGPITKNNIGLVMFATELNLTNPLPVGVGDKFTLGWSTLAGDFTDSMSETSVKGDFDSLLTIISTGMISGGPIIGPSYSPTRSKLTLVFADGALSGSFTTLPSTTSIPPAVPEMSTWSMLLAGFAGLGLIGLSHNRKRVGLIV